MSQTAPQGDGQISRVNCIAIRAEIGERLRSELDRNLTDTPMQLLQLMRRFQLLR